MFMYYPHELKIDTYCEQEIQKLHWCFLRLHLQEEGIDFHIIVYMQTDTSLMRVASEGKNNDK